jgi:phage baseplate assembly protein W
MTTYKDLDLTFNIHPIKKDLSLSTDIQAIIKSIKNIILTNHYEHPFDPDFGCNVKSLLFESINVFTASYIRKEIESAINKYEPRARLKNVDVTVTPDQNKYAVKIEFETIIYSKPIVIDFLLTKIR